MMSAPILMQPSVMTQTSSIPQHKPRPMIDLLVSILIPSVILMKFSGEDDLGATQALLLALAFPVCWGLFELLQRTADRRHRFAQA